MSFCPNQLSTATAGACAQEALEAALGWCGELALAFHHSSQNVRRRRKIEFVAGVLGATSQAGQEVSRLEKAEWLGARDRAQAEEQEMLGFVIVIGFWACCCVLGALVNFYRRWPTPARRREGVVAFVNGAACYVQDHVGWYEPHYQ